MISAKVVLDSKAPTGERLITLEAVYPRWMLSQLTKHRAFSISSESFRAVPFDKKLAAKSYVPVFTGGAKLRGMANGEVIAPELNTSLQIMWMLAERAVVNVIEGMQDEAEAEGLELCRGQINRLLEPFRYQKSIITGLDNAAGWGNFRKLRLGEGAQTETRQLAQAIFDAIDSSEPVERIDHVPYGPDIKRSVVTCARVSFLLGTEILSDKGVAKRFDKLLKNRHWSPFEHQAFAGIRRDVEITGNFYGSPWAQLRKALDTETVGGRCSLESFPDEVKEIARAESEVK